ncbi:MAG: DUF2017 family protein [Acidimicrobiales bacterium]|nr:DUF2017 family protein [Acidimicrobiales bacterium]
MSRRPNPVVQRQADGSFALVLDPRNVEALESLLGELDELLEATPDDPSLARLHPTAYSEDPDRDLAYQILAGDELRTKRRATIAAVRGSLGRSELTEDELWGWLQALNALRLVVGTRLGIDDDERDRPRLSPDDPDVALWDIYDFSTQIQYFVVAALNG